MKDRLASDDEKCIFSIIESHRKDAYDYVTEQMYEAFDEIGRMLEAKSMRGIGRQKINGISPLTIREIYRLRMKGKSCLEAEEDCAKRWFTEFIKAQSLSYEVQKARYPNFLKPWTSEDDESLERMWCEGVSEKELSRILMRHPNGIAARIAKLELVEKYGEREVNTRRSSPMG